MLFNKKHVFNYYNINKYNKLLTKESRDVKILLRFLLSLLTNKRKRG